MHFKYGIISEVKKGYAKVTFEEDEFVTDWLPVLVRKSKSDKESWQLEINEHVVCLMDETCDEGVIIGAIPNEEDQPDGGEGKGKFRKLFSDGTLIEYDKNSHKLTVDVKGELKAITTGKATITSDADIEANAGANLKGVAATKATIEAPAIDLTGNVKITGTATITGSLSAASIATVGGGSIQSSGNIETDGNISATGQVQGSDVKAGTVSLLTHKHGGVQSGGAQTTPPI